MAHFLLDFALDFERTFLLKQASPNDEPVNL